MSDCHQEIEGKSQQGIEDALMESSKLDSDGAGAVEDQSSDSDAQILRDLLGEDGDDEDDVSGDGNPDDAADLPIDEKCMAASKCVLQSTDHRKVVSHFFGRNKKCTRDIPPNSWIMWCRKHYQRLKYRAEEGGFWHGRQLALVREQLFTFERLSGITSWDVSLRKKEQSALNAENAALAAGVMAGPSAGVVDVAEVATAGETGSSDVNSASSGPQTLETTVTINPSSSTGEQSNHPIDVHSPAPSSPEVIPPTIMPSASIEEENKPQTVTTSPSRVDTKVTKIKHGVQVKDEPDALSSPPSSDEAEAEEKTTTEPVSERFLVPSLGDGKTYAEVRQILDAIETEFNTPAFQARPPKKKTFPGIEFLPKFPDAPASANKPKTKTTVNGPSKSKVAKTSTTTRGAGKKTARLAVKAKPKASSSPSNKQKASTDLDSAGTTTTKSSKGEATALSKRRCTSTPVTKNPSLKREAATVQDLAPLIDKPNHVSTISSPKRKVSPEQDFDLTTSKTTDTPPTKRRRSGTGSASVEDLAPLIDKPNNVSTTSSPKRKATQEQDLDLTASKTSNTHPTKRRLSGTGSALVDGIDTTA